jgi:hypothetical protein
MPKVKQKFIVLLFRELQAAKEWTFGDHHSTMQRFSMGIGYPLGLHIVAIKKIDYRV